MSRYNAVALVRWELPFALRLPPMGFLCWEPGEGVAAFDPRPGVGSLHWRRTCSFLRPEEIFKDLGESQDPKYFPVHDYLLVADLRSGAKIKTLQLQGGPDGGFTEVRPYTTANIFLCLRKREDYADKEVGQRAAAALNNVVE